MSNVSRLDSKQKRQFITQYIEKHPGQTLVEYNDEIRKRYGRGMDPGKISDIRDEVRHAKEMRKNTMRLQRPSATHLDEFLSGCEELCKMMDFSPVTRCTFTREGDEVTFVAEYDQVEKKTVKKSITVGK